MKPPEVRGALAARGGLDRVSDGASTDYADDAASRGVTPNSGVEFGLVLVLRDAIMTESALGEIGW